MPTPDINKLREKLDLEKNNKGDSLKYRSQRNNFTESPSGSKSGNDEIPGSFVWIGGFIGASINYQGSITGAVSGFITGIILVSVIYGVYKAIS